MLEFIRALPSVIIIWQGSIFWTKTISLYSNMSKTIKFLSLFIFFFSSACLIAQEDSLDYDISAFVWMDSMVITAQRSGFDVEEFIEMVQKDETFYKAFKNLRTLGYTAGNDIRMFGKNNIQAASYSSTTIQQHQDDCRTMEYSNEIVEGKYYKNKSKKYKYYTAKMYDRLFFTHGKKCSRKGNGIPTKKKGMEKYVEELKTLIFKPGEKVNVPLIKNKTAIFSKEMQKYYDYSITSDIYEDGIDCYIFTVKVKEEYLKKEKKTVIKFLETYFAKTDFQVIARNYTLAYKSALYDFDVDMEIKLQRLSEDIYVPSFISYDGNWDVPTKKPEISKFQASFYDFEF